MLQTNSLVDSEYCNIIAGVAILVRYRNSFFDATPAAIFRAEWLLGSAAASSASTTAMPNSYPLQRAIHEYLIKLAPKSHAGMRGLHVPPMHRQTPSCSESY
jgi:hypothetical protein